MAAGNDPETRASAGAARARFVLPACALVLGAVVLFLHARRYYPFFVDDSFISLRYAQRLAEGKGLTWTDGERVEGYSNLLWVLACAALGRAGVDLVLAARVLGAGATLAAFGAVLHGQRGKGLPGVVGGTAGVVVLALSGPIAIWAIGGLEQPLVAALLAWSTVGVYPLLEGERRAPLAAIACPGVLLGLLAVTRPDTGLFAAVAAASIAALRRPRREGLRIAGLVGVVAASFALAQLAFRLAYYGEWVPNTALAKVSFSPKRVDDGARVLAAFAAGFWPLWVPALGAAVAAFASPARRRRVIFLVASAAVWVLYVLAIGSDSFPAHRSLVPVVVLLALLLAEVAVWAAERGGHARVSLGLLLGALLAAHGVRQQKDPGNTLAFMPIKRLWQGRAIGILLKRLYGQASPPPLLAVDTAGVVPFYSELPALDMLGLCDAYLTHHRPPDFGAGLVGHELGDGAYVLRRAPDLLLSGLNGAPSLSYRGGRQLDHDPDFPAAYLLVNVRATDPEEAIFYAYVRREGKAGIQRSEGRVVVPGLLFATGRRPRRPGAPFVREELTAELDAAGAFGTTIPAGLSATYSGLRLAPGRWRAEAVTSAGEARAGLAGEEAGAKVAADDVDVRVVPVGGPAHLVEVRLSRVGE